jgi:hypothetical protein
MTTTALTAQELSAGTTRREARRQERYEAMYDAIAIFAIRALPVVVMALLMLGIIK